MTDRIESGWPPDGKELASSGTEAAPSRILALDIGDRRIGLAISDPLGYTAQPLFTLERTSLRADLKSIARVVRKHAVAEVVIGLPLHASGELSRQAAKTQAFADALRKQDPGLRLHLLDERLTTAEAHNLLNQSRPARRSKSGRKERTAVIDQVAAVLLLEAFMRMRTPVLLPPPSDL